ncbi:hypothetical protein [Haloplanus natans]|uniref:hypothetical protein n=1 Tax=Haloplanus natans TaxID=376171 RepID=UPI0006776147|nr:hypothetical protein [Haloplanus natans]
MSAEQDGSVDDPTAFDSEDSSPVITLLNNRYPNSTPVVRYAFPRDDGSPKQEPRLRSIHAPVPDEATWVSAIYFATDLQINRLNEYADNPYENLSPDNIAKTIQDECEDADRVLYPIHAESDAHEDNSDHVPLPTMVSWLREYAREVLNIPPGDCSFYYSGNRSIHIHSPLFVTGENLGWLKERTEQFCSETGADLDASVYKQKQQFRIPGADHHRNPPLQKAEIDPDWDHTEIISAAATDVARPNTYAEILTRIFDLDGTATFSDLLLSSTASDSDSQTSPLTTWESRVNRYDTDQRRAHTAPEFYPYPTGDNHDGRSVASVRVENKPFQRRTAGGNRTFVPCYFYGAHSCNGREYTKDEHYAPLQLSKADATKWTYEPGETLVIIGGGNYQSLIHVVDEELAEHIGDLLDPDEGRRADALEALQDHGYDVGSAGTSRSTNAETGAQGHESPQEETSPDQKSEALRCKERAEQGDIEASLSHGERRKVANRLLTLYGWDSAWNWFQEQYGEDFNPKRTWKGFKSIINTHSYDDDLAEITVPPSP